MKIGDFNLEKGSRPYIIAEIGVNHEGSMELAKKLIKEAKDGGANAAKFQSYKAEKIASKNSPSYWDRDKEPTDSQFKLFKKYDGFDERDYKELYEYCRDIGIDFMSTPFDLEAVEFLDPLMSAFKIASADITNIPLIRACASKRKPLIISTGAASLAEIELAVQEARKFGASDVSLLHCVLNYPTPEENAQLGMLEVLERVFPECLIGYSDHVVPDYSMSALEVAVLKGAVILEKHFTYDKSLPGNDHYHSMDVLDLSRFIKKIEKYFLLLSENGKDLSKEVDARKHARRSIVAAREIKLGEVIDSSSIIAKRPGHGISPIFWDQVIGGVATKHIEEDQVLSWDSVILADEE